ncbi:MAG: foldase protein PrsA [Actinomycetota bacterium]
MRKSLIGLLVLAACGGGSSGLPAATVNGVNITVGDIQAMRITEAARVSKADFAKDLTDAIINQIVVGAVKEAFSIEPTEAEVDAKVAELSTEIEGSQGVSVEEFFNSRSLPVNRLDVIATQQLIRDQLQQQFIDQAVPASDEDARLLLTSDPVGRTTACVRHILVASEGDAIDAKTRSEAGEDFAALASEVSTDGTAANGGDLGCQSLGVYVPEFAEAAYEAEIGSVTDPIESQFGWHLILVESREEPSLAQLRDEIDFGRVSQLIDGWLRETVNDAEVEVEPQYGVWVTDPTPQVIPPSG